MKFGDIKFSFWVYSTLISSIFGLNTFSENLIVIILFIFGYKYDCRLFGVIDEIVGPEASIIIPSLTEVSLLFNAESSAKISILYSILSISSILSSVDIM